jgi:hypothetical protein
MNGRVIASLAVGVILLCQNVRAQESVPPKKSTATLEQTLAWLKRNFEMTFTYGYTTLEKSGDTATASHNSSTVNRVPLSFDDCDLSWREGDEVISVSLKDLDPSSPAVRLHEVANSKFDSDLWELAMFTRARKSLVNVQSGEAPARSRSDVMLLYDNREDANKFARVFKHAIELCTQPVRSGTN